MPMNDAVREMLPEKRRIWILRYSRSKLSRASLSGEPMIASDGPPSPTDPLGIEDFRGQQIDLDAADAVARRQDQCAR